MAVHWIILLKVLLVGKIHAWEIANNPWIGHLHYKTDNPDSKIRFGSGHCSVFLIYRSDAAQDATDLALTAARCVMQSDKPSDMTVSFPSNDILIRVERIIVHNEFDVDIHRAPQHNVALLKFEKPITFTDHIKAIRLATKYSNSDCSFSIFSRTTFKSVVLPNATACGQDGGLCIKRPSTNNLLGFGMTDLGGPMVCKEVGVPVALGIFANGNKSHEMFADLVAIPNLLYDAQLWIDNDSIYEPYLPPVVTKYRTDLAWITGKQLFFLLEGIYGFLPYNLMLEIDRSLEEKSLALKSLFNKFYSRSKKIMILENKFAIGEIIGFTREEYIHTCAMKCAWLNARGLCNYLPSMKRCYFVEKPIMGKFVRMPAGQSLVIHTHTIEFGGNAIARAPILKTNYSIISKQAHQMWNVSLWVPGWSFHCLGRLSSESGEFYSRVNFATECLREIMGDKPHIAEPQILAVIDSQVLNVILTTQLAPHPLDYRISIAHIEPIRMPNGYPKFYGHNNILSLSPAALMRFSPESGAFMSKPSSMPWMVQIEVHEKLCTGVFISKANVYNAVASHGNECLKYILTTASCAQHMNVNQTMEVRLWAGSYFWMNQDEIGRGAVKGKRIHTDYSETVKNIAVLEVNPESLYIGSTVPIQPIPLYKTRKTFAKFVIAAWNVEGLINDQAHQMWNVSLWVPGWSFHCLGRLSSESGEFYSRVNFATDCLREIMGDKPHIAEPQILAVIDSQVLNVILTTQLAPHPLDYRISIAHIEPIRMPNGYPKFYGHNNILSLSPAALMRFSPESGAFMSKPSSMPWMVQIEVHEKLCTGVFISKADVYNAVASHGNERLKYILTTAFCAQHIKVNQIMDVRLWAGSYFWMNQNEIGRGAVKGKRIHTDYSETVKNIAVLEVNPESLYIGPTVPIQPIPLYKTRKTFAKFVIAAWNVEGSDDTKPLYEIPVTLLSSKSDQTILAKRHFGNGMQHMDQETDGKPLIGYTVNNGAFLVGLYAGKDIVDGQVLEKYVPIAEHVPWIQETLEFYEGKQFFS